MQRCRCVQPWFTQANPPTQAANLLKAGYQVTVWNRSPSRCNVVQEQGAMLGASPKAVMESCDIVFGMLADPEAALAVAMGPEVCYRVNAM